MYSLTKTNKNWTCGESHPGHCIKKKNFLTQVQKTPEPLPHPYTAALYPCENRAVP